MIQEKASFHLPYIHIDWELGVVYRTESSYESWKPLMLNNSDVMMMLLLKASRHKLIHASLFVVICPESRSVLP